MEESKAVKNQNVYLTDGNQYFNRPGPRIVDSLEILIEILYDLKYDFGHFGLGMGKIITVFIIKVLLYSSI